MKFCHYFHNGKHCPYERIGCMFVHRDSSNCFFGSRCTNNLCPYKHEENKKPTAEDTEMVELEDHFTNLTYEEKEETKDVFCDIYCNRAYDFHTCSEETNLENIGCDIPNIIDEFEDENDELPITYYPCNKCDERFDDDEKLRIHFSKNHTPEMIKKCAFVDCDFSTKTINMLLMHIGVNHLDYIRRKL